MCCGLHMNPLFHHPFLWLGKSTTRTSDDSAQSLPIMDSHFTLLPSQPSVLACALDSANQIQMPETLHGKQQIQRAETVENTFW